MLNHALQYLKMGFSVIPCQKNKKAIFAWADFQHTKPDKEQITQWWTKYPHANIAIICGEVSGVDVIDCDTEEAFQNFNENFLSDSIVTPIVKTPKGYHIYFQHRPGLSNAVRAIAGTDLRTTGGYVIAPPSIGVNGNGYLWFNGLSPKEATPVEMPDFVFDVLRQAAGSSGFPKTQSSVIKDKNTSEYINIYNIAKPMPSYPSVAEATTTIDNIRQQLTTNTIPLHQRDTLFFHLANCLVKGGMPQDNIQFFLRMFLLSCTEQDHKNPFTEKDIDEKIKSACDRKKNKDRNLTDEIRNMVMTTKGNISTTYVHKEQHLTTLEEKKKANVILYRLEKEGFIEKTGRFAGEFRIRDEEVLPSDFTNFDETPCNIWLPFNLHRMVEIMEGNIIGIYGEVESGKTAWLLNIARYNLNGMRVHYFNSESGKKEFAKRLRKFDDITMEDWKMFLNFYEVEGNFHDHVKPGPGNLNIVDFLEVHKDFYLVGEMIKKIHDKLKGAIAVIAIQKNPGKDEPLGGHRAMEKPRLIVSLSPGIAKIAKAKNWADGVTENPRYKSTRFKLVGGANLYQVGDWHRDVSNKSLKDV